jgi:hypothetical protein
MNVTPSPPLRDLRAFENNQSRSVAKATPLMGTSTDRVTLR